jgi:aspartate carbamoyltransferase regulatory subunit
MISGCSRKVTISFDSNGGNPVPSIETTRGSTANLRETVREGYFFGGWFLSNDPAEVEFANYHLVKESMTLYARWYTLEELVSQLKYSVSEEGVQITGYNNSPSMIVIPKTIENKPVVSIKASAFEKLSKLSRLEILADHTTIGDYAFGECPTLVTAKLPDSIKTIGKGAFYNCITLSKINIPAYLETVSPGIFLGCISLEEVDVPYGVTEVGDSAFAGCVGLKSVTIPLTVVAFGIDVFQDCTKLENIYTSASNIQHLTDLMVFGNRDYIRFIHSK